MSSFSESCLQKQNIKTYIYISAAKSSSLRNQFHAMAPLMNGLFHKMLH